MKLPVCNNFGLDKANQEFIALIRGVLGISSDGDDEKMKGRFDFKIFWVGKFGMCSWVSLVLLK